MTSWENFETEWCTNGPHLSPLWGHKAYKSNLESVMKQPICLLCVKFCLFNMCRFFSSISAAAEVYFEIKVTELWVLEWSRVGNNLSIADMDNAIFGSCIDWQSLQKEWNIYLLLLNENIFNLGHHVMTVIWSNMCLSTSENPWNFVLSCH